MAATIIDRSKCRAPRHGKYWMYDKYGCRCTDTVTDRSTRRARQHAGTQPPGYMNAAGTRRRLQALACEGWSIERIAELTGLADRTLRAAINTNARVHTTTARYVAHIYDRFAGHDGGSRSAAQWALRRGWLDSYHWPDDRIDNPQAKPWYGEDTAPRRATEIVERRAEIARLTAAGASSADIAAQIGVDERTVQRHRATIRQSKTATNQAAA